VVKSEGKFTFVAVPEDRVDEADYDVFYNGVLIGTAFRVRTRWGGVLAQETRKRLKIHWRRREDYMYGYNEKHMLPSRQALAECLLGRAREAGIIPKEDA
jgi:hypothetical protein